jgi:hypothetical protein
MLNTMETFPEYDTELPTLLKIYNDQCYIKQIVKALTYPPTCSLSCRVTINIHYRSSVRYSDVVSI